MDYSEGSVWTQLAQVHCRTLLLCRREGRWVQTGRGRAGGGRSRDARSAHALQGWAARGDAAARARVEAALEDGRSACASGWAAFRPHVRVGEVSSPPDPVS